MKATRATIEYEISTEDIGRRLDVVLTTQLCDMLQAVGIGDIEASRSRLKKWIEEGRVKIDQQQATKAGVKLRSSSEVISVDIPEGEPLSLIPDPKVKFAVVYEDKHLVVIDKPADLVVHPAPGNYSGTLVHGLLAYLGESLTQVGDTLRPGIVHRLDKGTSGLMVVAKTDLAYQKLRKQFEPPRTIFRTYQAIVVYLPQRKDSGVINLPIGRDPNNRKKMAVVESGREAVTKYQVERYLKCGYLLRCNLETGRTHQIRVHLAAAMASIVGDPLYGVKESGLTPTVRSAIERFPRQALHACELTFAHPATEKVVTFSAELPSDMTDLLQVLDG